MNSIHSQFKIQPVAAFYKLLGTNILYILGLSILIAIATALATQLSLSNALGSKGLAELSQLIEKPSKNILEQSKATQTFLLNHPKLVTTIFALAFLMLIFSSYLIHVSQRIIKAKLFDSDTRIWQAFVPNKITLNILLYLFFCGAYLLFTSGFIIIGISSSPIIGIITAVFIGLVLMRSILVVPGCVVGDMRLSESLKYSFQTISLGRSFKILLFGSLMFLMFLFAISTLLSLPLLWISASFFKIFINILTINMLIGTISIGMNSLFLRYAHFEEENIAE